MVNPIPTAVRKLWEKWNIRGVILTSLFLQLFLILFAPLRKSTHRSLVTWSLWSAYLLADCAANFCIGLIADRRDNITTTSINDYILAFWAPFLLLHLGGPDTITAFALEDNELWLRHLLGLLFQLGATVYVFLLTMPSNILWIPTALIFLSGLIKYTERTRSLYSASMNTFRHSMIPDPDAGPNYAKLMEEFFSKSEAGIPCSIVVVPEPESQKKTDEINTEKKTLENNVQVVRYAYYYFNKFKGLIVDMIYTTGDRNASREFFLGLKAEDAFRVIEVELNFIYEVFFTKVPVLRSKTGYTFRFVSFGCIVAAVVLFTLDKKHGFNQFDVDVSYTLLYGALALDSMAFLMLVFSDRTVVLHSDEFHHPDESSKSSHPFTRDLINFMLNLKEPRWSHRNDPKRALATNWLFRRWCGKISGHNLIEYCLKKSKERSPKGKFYNKALLHLQHVFDEVIYYFGAKDLVEKWFYKKSSPLLKKLWCFIFHQLEEKSKTAKDEEKMKEICTDRGEWVIKKILQNGSERNSLLPYVQVDKVAFDESLLLWHIATSLLYYADKRDDHDHSNSTEGDFSKDDQRIFSKLLSDYMLYLSVMEPNVMSPVAGIGQLRFQDTCEEAIKFFEKRLEEESTEEKGAGKASKESREEKAAEIASSRLLEVRTERKPIEVKGDRSKSLLFDGCMLAKELKKLKEEKWRVIAEVWVELLSYGASNCSAHAIVQQLSRGGELISFVWLLMVQLGLGTQFQIKEGHARAKLITGGE